jgi:hypothetical protein
MVCKGGGRVTVAVLMIFFWWAFSGDIGGR